MVDISWTALILEIAGYLCILYWTRLDQIGPDWTRLDQISLSLLFDQPNLYCLRFGLGLEA